MVVGDLIHKVNTWFLEKQIRLSKDEKEVRNFSRDSFKEGGNPFGDEFILNIFPTEDSNYVMITSKERRWVKCTTETGSTMYHGNAYFVFDFKGKLIARPLLLGSVYPRGD